MRSRTSLDTRVPSPYHPSIRSRSSLSPPHDSNRPNREYPRRVQGEDDEFRSQRFQNRDSPRRVFEDEQRRGGSRNPSIVQQSQEFDDGYSHYRQKYRIAGYPKPKEDPNGNPSLHYLDGGSTKAIRSGGASYEAKSPAFYTLSSSNGEPVDNRGNYLSFSSRNLNESIHKREDMQCRDALNSNKLPSQHGLYEEQENHQMLYRRGVMMMQSQSKGFRSTPEDSYMYIRSNGKYKEDTYIDEEYVPIAQTGASASERKNLFSHQLGSLSSSRLERAEREGYSYGEHEGYSYGERARKEKVDSGYSLDGLYGKVTSAGADYCNGDSVRPSYMDPDAGKVYDMRGSSGGQLDGSVRGNYSLREEPVSNYHNMKSTLPSTRNVESSSSGSKYLEYGGQADGDLWEHLSLQQEPVSNYLNVKSALTSTRNVESSSTGSKYLEFGTRVSGNQETSLPKGDYGFGREAGPDVYKERVNDPPISGSDPFIYEDDRSTKRKSKAENVGKYERSERVHKRKLKAEEVGTYERSERVHKMKYRAGEEMNKHDPSITLSSSGDGDISRRVQEMLEKAEKWSEENPGGLSSSKRFGDRLQYKTSGRRSNEIGFRKSFASQGHPLQMQGRMAKHHLSGVGKVSIKNRLKPAPRNLQDFHFAQRRDVFKPFKPMKRHYDEHYYNRKPHDGGPMEEHMLPVKPDLPEDSEEFKQLVHRAFLRFSKHLYEDPARWKKYKEQGNAGTLLCSVCGSSSKVFMDTQSLVVHTFMSLKVGMRADHLGLHRALCVMMGWNIDGGNNTWVKQIISDEEAWRLKEDLVLWPPVVIIHNNSIANKCPDERKVVTVEKMEAILAGIGFSGGTVKVCRGKPANQSIMVVKFNATHSGLLEAERLDQYYTENKHGRREFQHINSKNVDSSEEAEVPKDDKVNHFLYGYLGVAEDLDKLDFETKKKCWVKSKKDIQSIAAATHPADTDDASKS